MGDIEINFDESVSYVKKQPNVKKRKRDQMEQPQHHQPSTLDKIKDGSWQKENREKYHEAIKKVVKPQREKKPSTTEISDVKGPAPKKVKLADEPMVKQKDRIDKEYMAKMKVIPPKKDESQTKYQSIEQIQAAPEVFSSETFESYGLNEYLLKNIVDTMKIQKPTKIQQLSIPVICKGHDVLIKAPTGSGKTLAYLVPIVQKLQQLDELNRESGTHAIIVSPTRELALQIHNVLKQLSQPFPKIVSTLIMGGEKKKSEKARLRKGVTIVIATPGRLLDHMQTTSAFIYSNTQYLILDEADRLLDLGFEKELRQIITSIEEKSTVPRINVLASATLNQNVDRLALMSLKSPVFVSSDELKTEDDEDLGALEYTLPKQLKQHYVVVEDKRKLVTLMAFLRQKAVKEKEKIMVFFSNCDTVEYMYMLISTVEVPSADQDSTSSFMKTTPIFKLHGNLSQQVRSSTYQAFCKSQSSVLLCTDVASRGLDMPEVSWIVQYDAPSDPRAYIHRIGRTARIGTKGDALLMLFSGEQSYLDILTKRGMEFDLISEHDILATLDTKLDRNKKKDVLGEAGALQHAMDVIVENSKLVDLKSLAIKAFQSFISSYATHKKSTKHIFHIRNLHLGHICRNFALRDTPSEMNTKLRSAVSQKVKKPEAKRKTLKNTMSHAMEFDSGM